MVTSERLVYKEKDKFTWDPKQQKSFKAIQFMITNNAMSSIDPQVQFYLIINVNQVTIGGVLF